MTPSVLEEESTGNSLPVSLLFKNEKPLNLCSTYERPEILKDTSFLGYKFV